MQVLATTTGNTLYAWGYNQSGQVGNNTNGPGTSKSSPVQIGALTTWSNVLGGNRSSFAKKGDGTLWSWGQNNFGQLGLGDVTDRNSPVQIGALTTWNKLGGGSQHVLATTTSEALYIWGNNTYGQLGDGTTTHKSSPIQVGALTGWNAVPTGSSGSANQTLVTFKS